MRPGLLVLFVQNHGSNSLIGTYVKYPKKMMVTARVTVHFEIENGPVDVKRVTEELQWLREEFDRHFEVSHKDKMIASTASM